MSDDLDSNVEKHVDALQDDVVSLITVLKDTPTFANVGILVSGLLAAHHYTRRYGRSTDNVSVLSLFLSLTWKILNIYAHVDRDSLKKMVQSLQRLHKSEGYGPSTVGGPDADLWCEKRVGERITTIKFFSRAQVALFSRIC